MSIVAERIAQGAQDHALMMCHVSANRQKALSGRHALRRIVRRLKQTKRTHKPEPHQFAQVGYRGA